MIIEKVRGNFHSRKWLKFQND